MTADPVPETNPAPEPPEPAEDTLLLDAVATTAERILSAASWVDAIDDVLELLGLATGASRAYVFESRVDAEGRMVSRLSHEWCAPGILASSDGWRQEHVEENDLIDLIQRGVAVEHRTSLATGWLREQLELEGTISGLTVPIPVRGEVSGYIGFDDCVHGRSWRAGEIETLRVAASVIGGAIDRTRAMESVRTRDLVLEAIADATGTLLAAPSWRACIDDLLARIGSSLGASRAFFFESTPTDDGGLVSRVAGEWCAPGVGSLAALPAWSSFHEEPAVVARLRRGEPHAFLTSERTGEVRAVLEEAGVLAGLDVPVLIDGVVEGYFGFDQCDEERVWLEAEIDVLRTAGRSLSAAIARERAVEALLESEARLRQAQKLEAMGRLAGGIAHDFNNHLTAIGGFADLLHSELEGSQRADAEEILRASKRAQELTRRLLGFARPQEPVATPLDVNDVVEETTRMLRRLLGEQVALEVRLDPGGAPVVADRHQLEQLLVNLTVNARDAVRDGGTVRITTDAPAGARQVSLVVSDDGQGMDDETRQRIFDPFFTTKASGAGTGLGLATVYGIVTGAGGSIEVSSAPGEGARFTVLLPRVELQSVELQSVEP